MSTPQTVTLDRGVFTISLDFELIWGTLDLLGPEGFKKVAGEFVAALRKQFPGRI